MQRTEFTAIARNDPTVPPGHWLDGAYTVEVEAGSDNPMLLLE